MEKPLLKLAQRNGFNMPTTYSVTSEKKTDTQAEVAPMKINNKILLPGYLSIIILLTCFFSSNALADDYIAGLVAIDSAVTEGAPLRYNVTMRNTAGDSGVWGGDVVTVNYTVTGVSATGVADFTPVSGFVTFDSSGPLPKPGVEIRPISINTVVDGLIENNEILNIEITGHSYSSGAGTVAYGPSLSGVINDNDGSFLVSVDATSIPASSLEGVDQIVTVRTDKAVAWPIQVNLNYGGNATKNTDYSVVTGEATDTFVTIPAGDLSATVTIKPLADSIVEGAEQYTVQLDSIVPASRGGIHGTDNEATGTITSADVFEITIGSAPSPAPAP